MVESTNHQSLSSTFFEMNIRVGDGQPSPYPMKHLEDPVIMS